MTLTRAAPARPSSRPGSSLSRALWDSMRRLRAPLQWRTAATAGRQQAPPSRPLGGEEKMLRCSAACPCTRRPLQIPSTAARIGTRSAHLPHVCPRPISRPHARPYTNTGKYGLRVKKVVTGLVKRQLGAGSSECAAELLASRAQGSGVEGGKACGSTHHDGVQVRSGCGWGSRISNQEADGSVAYERMHVRGRSCLQENAHKCG